MYDRFVTKFETSLWGHCLQSHIETLKPGNRIHLRWLTAILNSLMFYDTWLKKWKSIYCLVSYDLYIY